MGADIWSFCSQRDCISATNAAKVVSSELLRPERRLKASRLANAAWSFASLAELVVGVLLEEVDSASVKSDVGDWMGEGERELVKSMTSCVTAGVIGATMSNGSMSECCP